jgi:hypothetical protein
MYSNGTNPKRGWLGGDYFISSHHLQQWVSEALCERMDLHASGRALDIA